MDIIRTVLTNRGSLPSLSADGPNVAALTPALPVAGVRPKDAQSGSTRNFALDATGRAEDSLAGP